MNALKRTKEDVTDVNIVSRRQPRRWATYDASSASALPSAFRDLYSTNCSCADDLLVNIQITKFF